MESRRTSSLWGTSRYIRPTLNPTDPDCASVKDCRYSPSARLVRLAQLRLRCGTRLLPRAVRRGSWLVAVAALSVGLLATGTAFAQRASERRVANPGETQFDVQVLRPSGGPVIPIFEGWYQNLDGTYELSFGYFNTNTDAVLEAPLGPDNFIAPAELDGRQPTRFEPVPEGDRRHWGVFTVTVPSDFGDGDVVWTLRTNEQTLSVPGRLTRSPYQLAGWEFPGRASVAPLLKWGLDAVVGRGPAGVTAPPILTTVGDPHALSVWATRDGAAGVDERPINLKWFKHQGPGEVSFGERTQQVESEAWVEPGSWTEVTTDATFSEPGEYLLRVLAFNVVREFEFQCCWTNGFVPVTVSP